MPCFPSRSRLPHAPGNFPPRARSGSILGQGPTCRVLLSTSLPAGTRDTGGTQRGHEAPGHSRAPLPLQHNSPRYSCPDSGPVQPKIPDPQRGTSALPGISCHTWSPHPEWLLQPLGDHPDPKAFSQNRSGAAVPIPGCPEPFPAIPARNSLPSGAEGAAVPAGCGVIPAPGAASQQLQDHPRDVL